MLEESKVARDKLLKVELDQEHDRAEDEVPNGTDQVQDLKRVEQGQHACRRARGETRERDSWRSGRRGCHGQ